MRGLDTDHSEQLHVDPDDDNYSLYDPTGLSPRYWCGCLLGPARRPLQFLLFVPPVFVLVSSLQTLPAIGCAGQALQVTAVTLRTLPLRQHSADDALPGTGHYHVRHVQQLRGKDPLVQLELPSKPIERMF